MIFEICTDSVEGAIAAEKYGAKRIELCSALSVGGLTPSFGLIHQCAKQSNVEVHSMIRHKEGGFNYNTNDIELMKLDIATAKKAGAYGVVFGILDDNNVVSDQNLDLVNFANSLGLETTFHRAFDFVIDYKSAIQKIISFGFDRLLTSGLQPTAIEGLDVIQELESNYGNKIQIMAGSGINKDNALTIASSGVNNMHFTAKKKVNTNVKLSMGAKMVVDEEKINEIISKFNDDHNI